MSNIFQWNIYEKSFTPYWASIADKKYVHRHVVKRSPSNVSAFWQDNRTKNMLKFMRRTIMRRTYLYHFSIVVCKEIY